MITKIPLENQSEAYTEILKVAFDKFVPKKTVLIRPSDQSWGNDFTHLLSAIGLDVNLDSS